MTTVGPSNLENAAQGAASRRPPEWRIEHHTRIAGSFLFCFSK